MLLAIWIVAAMTTPAPSTTPLAPGTRVRLSARPRVEVPGLYSGDRKRAIRPAGLRREGPLLLRARTDGASEGVLEAGASVTGAFAGAEGPWILFRRSEKEAPLWIHGASVARAHVASGQRRPVGKRALQGLGVGAGIGGALTIGAAARTSEGLGGENRGYVLLGAAFAGAVGATVGAVAGIVGETEWREVPLDALRPLSSPAPAPAE